MYEHFTDLQLALLIRAVNTELNVISHHYHTDKSETGKEVWERQYNELNLILANLHGESARRKYMTDFPPNTIEERQWVTVTNAHAEYGRCDVCNTLYETYNRTDHCAECGTCWEHCRSRDEHSLIAEFG